MKAKETAKKMAYIGGGAGLVLFAVVGLFPGSFLGGVIGLKLAGGIFGMPVSSTLLPRLIVGISMIAGALVSGLAFIAGSTVLGWLAGSAIDSFRTERREALTAK